MRPSEPESLLKRYNITEEIIIKALEKCNKKECKEYEELLRRIENLKNFVKVNELKDLLSILEEFMRKRLK